MSKILQVALREFLATVATKGFIIGVMITPLIVGVMVIVMPRLLNEKPPKVEGEIALYDPTGEVEGGIRDYLAAEAIAKRWDDTLRDALAEAPDGVRAVAEVGMATDQAQQAMETALGEAPILHINTLEPGFDLEAEKARLRENPDSGERLALVVVHENAVRPAPGEETFGKYDVYIREKLDDRINDEIRDAMRESIVDARVRIAGLDRERIDALTKVGRVRSTTVTERGERETNELVSLLLPMGFMILLLVSVITCGQQIMTTTIEEKSSRVVEVLLSAVSPMQLMSGKIFGQLVVGLLLIGIYAGMGIAALVSFTLLGILDPWLFLYLLIFYLIAYFTMGSLMAAIGAAVNELREAQTLMTPVMIVMIIPWMLWMPISRDPNSTFATITSFLPPINSFVMLLRMTSATPPPMWQVWLSIAIGIAAAYGALWVAAKIFRVGLLMFGKPPNLSTLVRWVRMA